MSTPYLLILGGLGLALALGALVAWLKGTLGLVAEVFGAAGRRVGEPWTLGMLIEPALSVPATFVAAAVRLARPDSRWADWFYGERRRARSHERYAER